MKSNIFIRAFTFNAFNENTYIVHNDVRQAILIDPGCSDLNERKILQSYIKKEGLTPTHIINTHCHIDHVLGNKWCKETYQIPLWIPEGEQLILDNLMNVSRMYGVPAEASPIPDFYMNETSHIDINGITWQLISAPGHSPASICLYHEPTHDLIAGDVLFLESIGRTDLTGGNHQLLLKNIREKLFTLPIQTKVYPGHGPTTTIGHEKIHNPFL